MPSSLRSASATVASPKSVDPGPSLPVNHDVGRLEIAVQNAPFVGGSEAGTELLRDLDRLVLRQPADPTQQAPQIFAVDELHREELFAVDVSNVIDGTDVRMGNLTGQADFVAKELESGRVAGSALRKEFEGDGLVEFQIVGPVHLAHAAAAEQGDDAVSPGKAGSREESSMRHRRTGGPLCLGR